ncbi:hypothetical protein XENTR_v10021573 [Xenopus tropicalis]|uniref:G protein-coupled receptor 65 n=1 Tax=Xenopus tropicalis TaxID=8364 RepID=A0A6I8QWZ1_XENTR|nr:psychosine receptor [Xenopus tropicalis]XP_012825161.1 psychosine receptor [Xenopus tropicalis]KAE8586162.1 hypothetical protein XENTR_v10021573 [Xenopus tropicalis]KAE8586163.1 hypothetical protein XENTR_v10021573 [Xenopus tropicalis]|eukprot:XP_012825161.1 PREDICTED: psychosine receptor [Xenopus tropicalis]
MINIDVNCSINHDIDQYLFPVTYITVIVISIPTNCISLYVSCLQIKKKNELGIYLFNLSFSDLLYTLILPLWVYYSLSHNNWMLSEHVCSLVAFLLHTNLYSSAGFLTCISLDRYLAVVHPLKFSHLRTIRTAILVSFVVWLIQHLSNAIILTQHELFNSSGDLTCYDIFPMEPWKSSFNIIHICIGHLLPLFIMVLCYQRIFAAVKTNQATADRDKQKIKQLLLTIIVSFVISFTPYHVVLFIRSIREPGDCDFAKDIFTPYKFTLALTSINCIADPFLYCFVSEAGRADVRTILHCCGKQTEPLEKSGIMMSAITPSTNQENV